MAHLMERRDYDELRHRLMGGEPFLEMARAFVDHSVEALTNPDFKEYWRTALGAVTDENAHEIAELAGSPIEKTFLYSLLLTFIKGNGLLLVHRTYKDTPSEIADFRKNLAGWREFFTWFQTNRPAARIEDFLDGEVGRGAMSPDERQASIRYIFRYTYVPMDGFYHMTLQPRFPNVKIGAKQIRPDMYFWIPSKPEVNIIVECDGFSYHSDREEFKTDRQRDRALKALGYDVFRFSGSEIYNDPINAPYELVKYLSERARDAV